jgi:murein L,D-transpeptidase YcbB/YkuD
VTICSKKISLMILLAVMYANGALATAAAPDQRQAQVAQRIKIRIMAQNNRQGFVCRGEPICGVQLIPLFYAGRDFQPAWFDEKGPNPYAGTLLQAVSDSVQDGLQPSDYHLDGIRAGISQLNDATLTNPEKELDLWADLDLLLTDAFLLLGSHLSAGRVNPETLHSDWLISARSVDLMSALNAAVTPGEKGIEAILEDLRPTHPDYRRLRKALNDLHRIANTGGWPSIADGQTLRLGNRDPRVETLRQHLILTGDLSPDAAPLDPQFYDASLADAVKRFQGRHGVQPDGILGRQTTAVLNVPVLDRIRQVELNLERWRWLPHDLGQRYLLVNIADFNLKVIENQSKVLEMRVVVGRPARRSPVFSAKMTYMVLNPYWTVPPSIAVKDILPRLKKGEDYLAQQGFKVFNGWTEAAEEIDPQWIDWALYNRSHFPFRLRQEPGPNNALGRIKFMFPNKFDVYLHDTPQRSLFDRVKRDFSSGCIRVEDAVGLAAYLLKEDPAWSPGLIQQTLATVHDQVVLLKTPIVVHLIYMTAWVDPDGSLQFRNDIYDRDSILEQALSYRPQQASGTPKKADDE